MRIATWNVNSIRLRLPSLKRFVESHQPDVICFQETKVVDELFPAAEIKAMGYPYLIAHGQKSYNGVAIASRLGFTAPEPKIWCKKDDRRHVQILLPGYVELHNFYVPSGGPIPDVKKNDKFKHKLQFLKEMAAWAEADKVSKRKVMIVGDLNVAPMENDVWDHKRLVRNVGHTPTETKAMETLWQAGQFQDVPRRFVPPDKPLFSWWGYRFPQSYEKNYGWRLDHVLSTPKLAPLITRMQIVEETRTYDQPSDHVPVMVDIG